jgi:hypothetical protein
MSRNGGGVYLLPEPPFLPNTVISSSAVNSDFSDIADALTGSLARDGQGGMTGPLQLASQGMTYLSDPNTGLRRSAADTQEIFGGGLVQATIGPTGADFAVPLKQNGLPLLPVGLGPLPWPDTTAPSGWVLAGATYNRADRPALWTFAQAAIANGSAWFTNGNGTTTFTIASGAGYALAGVDSGASITPGLATVGAITGFAAAPILLPELPNFSPAFTGQLGNASSTVGAVPFGATQSFNYGSGGLGALIGSVTAGSLISSFTPVGTVGSINGAQAQTNLSRVQPTRAVNFIFYAGV